MVTLENGESRREDLFKPPEKAGETLRPLRPYGVGIDVHKRFVQVCVLVNDKQESTRFERSFSTDWADLKGARTWVLQVLQESCAEPPNSESELRSTFCWRRYP